MASAGKPHPLFDAPGSYLIQRPNACPPETHPWFPLPEPRIRVVRKTLQDAPGRFGGVQDPHPRGPPRQSGD